MVPGGGEAETFPFPVDCRVEVALSSVRRRLSCGVTNTAGRWKMAPGVEKCSTLEICDWVFPWKNGAAWLAADDATEVGPKMESATVPGDSSFPPAKFPYRNPGLGTAGVAAAKALLFGGEARRFMAVRELLTAGVLGRMREGSGTAGEASEANAWEVVALEVGWREKWLFPVREKTRLCGPRAVGEVVRVVWRAEEPSGGEIRMSIFPAGPRRVDSFLRLGKPCNNCSCRAIELSFNTSPDATTDLSLFSGVYLSGVSPRCAVGTSCSAAASALVGEDCVSDRVLYSGAEKVPVLSAGRPEGGWSFAEGEEVDVRSGRAAKGCVCAWRRVLSGEGVLVRGPDGVAGEE